MSQVPNAESFFCADAAVKQYIDLAFQCSGAQYCTPSTPFFVLADVFDCLTLQRCSVLFRWANLLVVTCPIFKPNYLDYLHSLHYLHHLHHLHHLRLSPPSLPLLTLLTLP